MDDLVYAYSRRFDAVPVFTQYPDHVENRADASVPYGWENISLLTREKFAAGTRIGTRCAFLGDGAPLITLAASMEPDERGVLRFGEYLEIVLYKRGVNVWRMWYDPAGTKNGGVSWKKLMGVEFPGIGGRDPHAVLRGQSGFAPDRRGRAPHVAVHPRSVPRLPCRNRRLRRCQSILLF